MTLKKKHNVYFFVIIFFCVFCIQHNVVLACETERLIAQEIMTLKKNDRDIQRRCKIKDNYIKSLLCDIDKMNHIQLQKTFFSRGSQYFFLNIFPGIDNGFILLNEQQAPKLHAMIQLLADKMNIAKPVIFLSADEELYNAYASSLGKDLSLVVLGQKLLNKLCDKEIQAVLAHELAHIKHNHVLKLLGCSGAMLVLIFVTWKLLQTCNVLKKTDLFNIDTFKQFLFGSPYGQLVLISFIFGTLFTGIQLWLLRTLEKEADMESIKVTNDPQSFVNMIQKLEREVEDEKQMFEDEYAYLERKIDKLAKTCPLYADFLEFFAGMYYGEKQNAFDDQIERDNGTHPSLETRKTYGALENP